VVEREAEQHNLILTQTYDTLIPLYGFIDMVQYAAVGTGSTPPDPSQTALVNQVARVNRLALGYSYLYTATRVADGVVDVLAAREFTEAEVGGRNLTEWGFAPRDTGTDSRLAVRELFRDGGGNPIVLTMASDQRLRLLYKMRLTVGPVTPQSVSIDIGGIGVRTGKLVMRKTANSNADPYNKLFPNVTDYADIHVANGFAYGAGGNISNVIQVVRPDPNTYYYNTAYYSSNLSKGIAYQSYVANSRQRKSQSVIWLSTEANVTIYGIGLGEVGAPQVLLIFDPGQEFTKSNLYKLQIDPWTLSWGP